MRIKFLSVAKLRNGKYMLVVAGGLINNDRFIPRLYYKNENFSHYFSKKLDIMEIYEPTNGGLDERLTNLGKLVWCRTDVSEEDKQEIKWSKYSELTVAELVVIAKGLGIYDDSLWRIPKVELIKKIKEAK